MTRAEIAQLKEKLTADYRRKLEALELVEQMLNQRQSPATSARSEAQRVKVRSPATVVSGTIAARIEQAFRKQPKWTVSALMSAMGVKHRATLWKPLKGPIKEGKVRISEQGGRGRGRPSEYARVTG